MSQTFLPVLRRSLLAATLTLVATTTADAQQQRRERDPRSMGGGDCRDNPYNCKDAPNPLPAPNTVWLEENQLGKVIASVSELPGAVDALLSDLPLYHQHVQQMNNQAVFEVVDALGAIKTG